MDVILITRQQDLEQALADDDQVKVIEAYIALGQAYLDLKKTTKAYTQFDLAIKIAQEIDHQALKSRLLGLTGICQKQLGNYEMSLETLQEALATAQEIKDARLTGDAQYHIGALLTDMEKPLEAISYLDNALAAALQEKDNHRKLVVTNLLGNIFLSLESIEKAVENFATALDTAQILGNREAEAASRVHLAQAFLVDKEYQAAIENFEVGLSIADQGDYFSIELQALHGLTQACAGTGNTSLAAIYGEQLVNKTRLANLPAKELAAIQTLVGVFNLSENYTKALPYLERAVGLSREVGDDNWELKSLVDLGTAAYLADKLDLAKTHLQEALDKAQHLQQDHETAVISGRLASVLADAGEYLDSNQLIEQTLKLAEILDLPLLKGEQLVLQALNYQDQDQIEDARERLAEAIQLYQQIDRPDLVKGAEELLDEIG